MSAATKDLVAAVKANTSLKCEDLDARRHSKWMQMAEMYMGMGENEKAMSILSKIEEAEAAAGTVSTTNHDSEIKSTIEVECDNMNHEETFGKPPEINDACDKNDKNDDSATPQV